MTYPDTYDQEKLLNLHKAKILLTQSFELLANYCLHKKVTG